MWSYLDSKTVAVIAHLFPNAWTLIFILQGESERKTAALSAEAFLQAFSDLI